MSSDSGSGGIVASVLTSLGLSRGDFLSEPFLSRPLPSTTFRRDPLRLRLLLFERASDIALRLADTGEARSVPSASLPSPSLLRSMFSLANRLPDIDLLCPPEGFLLSLAFGVSSSTFGKGMVDSVSFESFARSFIAA